MARAGIGGDPGGTVAEGVDLLGGKGGAGLLLLLAQGGPGVGDLVEGSKIALDDNEGAYEAAEGDTAKDGNCGGVGDKANKEAWNAGTGEHTSQGGGCDDEQDSR